MKPLVISSAVAAMTIISAQSQAAILSNQTETRIQIRKGSSETAVMMSQPAPVASGINSGDRLQGLIEQKQRDYASVNGSNVMIEERKRVTVQPASQPRPSAMISRFSPSGIKTETYQTVYYNDSVSPDFNRWLNSDPYRAQQVANYQRYLSAQLGAYQVPALSQLLTTARSWDKCGYEPFQLPPEYLWGNVVATLKLYTELKRQGILPASTEIRSVYRSPGLNSCAGGAAGSKHLTAGAIDIWVPEFEGQPWQLSNLQEGLCQFWQYQGAGHHFGLGLYATGAIHLDTQGYRKWGFEHSTSTLCRY